MIRLKNVSKTYRTRNGMRTVLDGIDLDVLYGEKFGILGRNGAGKSTLVRLISGIELPSNGAIERRMSVSWPLALGGGFQGSLTGVDNVRFISRVYDATYESVLRFVEDFSELGSYLREPIKSYSSGMRARLAFAISMAVDFDCFLIDEVIAVGDHKFQEKCKAELFERRSDRAMIFVSHDPVFIRAHCERAGVLDDGKLVLFDSVDEALSYHEGAEN